MTTAGLVAGASRIQLWRTVPRWLLFSTGVFSLASWLVTHLAYQAVAPRVASMFLPLWIGLSGLALSRVPRRAAVVGVALLLVCLNTWTLYELARVHSAAFIRI